MFARILTLLTVTILLAVPVMGSHRAISAQGSSDEVEVLNKQQVYYGDPKNFSSASVVSAKKIFDEIPAYKQIKDEGLDKNDPRYWILLEKANKVFKKVVKKAAKSGGYDLVAEVGALKGADEFPNLTAECIDLIEEEDDVS